jgi:hypothetical protein
MNISPATRRNIADAIAVGCVNWAGRLEEQEFLSRLFDLKSLPSTDGRFEDAAGDIWKHRVMNSDWNDDWVFYDRRFNLLGGDDETFLRFLCETLHPVVRPDPTEAERLRQLYNEHLKPDGFQLVEKTRMSGRPVYAARHVGIAGVPPGIAAARTTLAGMDAGYVAQQITRMEAAVDDDPELALGTAKELVETCCKTILDERGISIPKDVDLPQLLKLTCKELELTPPATRETTKAEDTIRRILGSLATITQGVAELRNLFGTGHGKKAGTRSLTERHARLAVGAASTLAVFLVETHQVSPKSKP